MPQMLIDGRPTPAASGAVFAVHNPATEEVIEHVPLAAGNAVVLKPSAMTRLSALRFAELCCDHLPAGVLNVVTGDRIVPARGKDVRQQSPSAEAKAALRTHRFRPPYIPTVFARDS